MSEKKRDGRRKDDGTDGLKRQIGSMTGDLLTMSEAQRFPDIENIPKRAQIILIAVAAGYGQKYIAEALGIKQPAISQYMKKYDPHGIVRNATEEAQKAFRTQLVHSRMVEALSSITPEKMQSASAGELSNIARNMQTISDNMNQRKHREMPGGLDSIIDAMVDEAEYTEVKEDDGEAKEAS